MRWFEIPREWGLGSSSRRLGLLLNHVQSSLTKATLHNFHHCPIKYCHGISSIEQMFWKWQLLQLSDLLNRVWSYLGYSPGRAKIAKNTLKISCKFWRKPKVTKGGLSHSASTSLVLTKVRRRQRQAAGRRPGPGGGRMITYHSDMKNTTFCTQARIEQKLFYPK